MIYLADDDVEDLELFQDALKIHSYKGPVRTAMNGEDLMTLLKTRDAPGSPYVIVLDLNMPLKDGFQALQEIKTDHHLNGIPVIVLTSSAKKADEIKCFELGCNFYYTKPSRLDDYTPLVNVVKSIVETRAAANS